MSAALLSAGTYATQVLLAHWVLGSLVVLVFAVVLAVLPRLNAATLHLAWSLCLVSLAVSFLFPTLISSSSPPAEPLLGARTSSPQNASRPSEDLAVGQATSAALAANRSEANSSLRRRVQTAVVGSTQWVRSRLSWQPRNHHSTALRIGWLTFGWIALALWTVLLAARLRTVVGALWQLRALSRSSLAPDAATERLVAELSRRAGLTRTPKVVRNRELEGPACLGVVRPCIGLPESWPSGWSEQARRHALLHEIAHVARRDGLWTLLHRLVEPVVALHPTTGWIRGRIELAREQACDDWAVAHSGGEVTDYGHSLIEFAKGPSQTMPRLAAGFLGTSNQLERRLIHMLNASRSHDAKLRRTPLLLGSIGAIVFLLSSAAVWPRFPATVQVLTSSIVGLTQLGEEHDMERLNADDSMLYLAIKKGDPERVRLLLDDGENLHQVWPGDGSPLIEAARVGSAEILRLLLDRGAQVDVGVGGDGTALIAATRSGDVELVDLLLSYGADIDHAGRGGDGNPLIAASLAGDEEMARYLLQRGAALDVHVPNDDTPLVNAAQGGHLELVRFYLREGADPDLEGDYDRRLERRRTPLNQAVARGHRDVADLLRSVGARE